MRAFRMSEVEKEQPPGTKANFLIPLFSASLEAMTVSTKSFAASLSANLMVIFVSSVISFSGFDRECELRVPVHLTSQQRTECHMRLRHNRWDAVECACHRVHKEDLLRLPLHVDGVIWWWLNWKDILCAQEEPQNDTNHNTNSSTVAENSTFPS